MPVVIPDVVEEPGEAREAVRQYLRWKSSPTLRMLSFDHEVEAVFTSTDKVLTDLEEDPSRASPVVLVKPPGRSPAIIGRPKIPTGRESITLSIPTDARPAPIEDRKAGRVVVLGKPLVEAAAGSTVLWACSDRCSAIAELDAGRGRSREARYWRFEAAALERLALQLEEAVPVLGAQFVLDWRAQADRRDGHITPTPAVRAVALR